MVVHHDVARDDETSATLRPRAVEARQLRLGFASGVRDLIRRPLGPAGGLVVDLSFWNAWEVSLIDTRVLQRGCPHAKHGPEMKQSTSTTLPERAINTQVLRTGIGRFEVTGPFQWFPRASATLHPL